MGIRVPVLCSRARIAARSPRSLSISGICRSMRTTSNRLLRERIDRLAPVHDHDGLMTPPAEQVLGECAVHHVVLRHQDAERLRIDDGHAPVARSWAPLARRPAAA